MKATTTARRVVGARFVEIRSPLRGPVRTAAGTVLDRVSTLVALRTGDGIVGWGEFAPWPPQRCRTDAFRTAADRLRGDAEVSAAVGVFDTGDARRAAHAAFETALCDIDARRRGCNLAASLAGRIGGAPSETIAVNSFGARAHGARTVKVKVGTYDLETDRRRLVALRRALGPQLRIRIDANGAWTTDEATRALEALADVDIELVEQPVAGHDIDGLAAVRRGSSIPVVADEAVVDTASLAAVVDHDAADGVMLKPSRIGGPQQTLDLGSRVLEAGLSLYLSSSFEFAVGRCAAIHTAAALAPRARGPHGLATAEMLASDIGGHPPPRPGPRDAVMEVPTRPGLGVVPDPQRLHALTILDTEL